MLVYGIFRKYCGLSYGDPLDCYLAKSRNEAWIKFAKAYSISVDNRHNYGICPV